MQVYKLIMKSTGIDFFTFYATTGAVKCNHQLIVATTGAFTLTSVLMGQTDPPKITCVRYFRKSLFNRFFLDVLKNILGIRNYLQSIEL